MAIDWFPLFLSLRVASLATAIALPLGLWLAWLLAHSSVRGKRLLSGVLILPAFLPSTVIAWYLLKSTGKLAAFTWYAAVIASLINSLPLLARQLSSALRRVPSVYVDAARTLGASEWRTFWRVSLPEVWGPVLAAIVTAFSRSLGEFGITLILAGNIPSETQTLPVAVYDAILVGRSETALVFVLLLSAVGLISTFAVTKLGYSR